MAAFGHVLGFSGLRAKSRATRTVDNTIPVVNLEKIEIYQNSMLPPKLYKKPQEHLITRTPPQNPLQPTLTAPLRNSTLQTPPSLSHAQPARKTFSRPRLPHKLAPPVPDAAAAPCPSRRASRFHRRASRATPAPRRTPPCQSLQKSAQSWRSCAKLDSLTPVKSGKKVRLRRSADS